MNFEPSSVRRRATGEILENGVYTLREFLRRADMGDSLYRIVRRRLITRRVGRKVYVFGRDWFAFLASTEARVLSEDEPVNNGPDDAAVERMRRSREKQEAGA